MPPAEELSPLTWAHVGDAVWEVYVRAYLVCRGLTRIEDLHRQAAALVSAEGQARVLARLEPWLSPEESDIVRRGRNAKGGNVPRHGTVMEYRYSTALEALFGYLFLQQNTSRMDFLFDQVVKEDNHGTD